MRYDDEAFPLVALGAKGVLTLAGNRPKILIDSTGRVIVCTTSKERAELKRDQIHAFGPDPLIPRCKGSMSATIEPATET